MMTPTSLKPRQRAFVDGVHRGLSLAAAARQAGYAAGSARQTGSRLMQHPAIIEALERRRAGYTGMPPVTDDPREFLIWCMYDLELLGMRERIGVAAFLMAYPTRA
ncbi:terminase small subunit [Xenophilus sp. Marseille-Q4582]|uniref:terminase small subunit n=1 Tax=Xenophilus sp. Marseille-Q4582 TaxID=2866600 RepID=UPI001CE47A87|nr:terminase small subunit [Xenophilus sp. Marseille-Q4582]